MITHIKGRLSEKSPTNVVIETNGIGYWINISLTTFSQIPDQENIKLFTHLQIKEDSHSLYGFYTLKEREIFRLLISVSGVGTSIARTMLSSLTPEQVIDAISSNNVSIIQSVKGIGSKTAQRLIIELRDKVLKIYEIDDEGFVNSNNTTREEALSALEVLGINKKSAERLVNKIIKDNIDITVEEIIKETLKNI
jgi:Holliday junction DNA helicase RuvA